MSKEEKKNSPYEIDDFAQALLDKKTETVIHADDPVDEGPKTDREDAEQKLSSALDRLRKERGQKSIEQEERDYSIRFHDPMEMDEFDTASFRMDDEMTQQAVVETALHGVQPKRAEKEEKTETNESTAEQAEPKPNKKQPFWKRRKTRSKPAKPKADKEGKPGSQKIQKNQEARPKSAVQEFFESEEPADPTEAEPTKEENNAGTEPAAEKSTRRFALHRKQKPPKSPRQKMKWIVILTVFLAGALLLCAYSYKVIVYDPAHLVTEQQQKCYDQFVSYADEWDMLSDTEKNELISSPMQKKYKKLNEQQKTDINAYFKEQTGKTLTARIKELKQKKTNKSLEKDENYQTIIAYLNDWDTYDDSTKSLVVQYKDMYKQLNSYLQDKVNDLSKKKTDKSFLTLIQEYETTDEEETETDTSTSTDSESTDTQTTQSDQTQTDSQQATDTYSTQTDSTQTDTQGQYDYYNTQMPA